MSTIVASLIDPKLIAGLFVLFSSWRRFDTPPSNRASTTPGRYYLALAVYLFAALTAYAITALSPELLNEVLPNAAAPLFSDGARQFGAPFFAALVVTVLLPTIPILCEPENMLRSFLQDLAAIPYQATLLRRRLRAAELRVSDRQRVRVAEWLISLGGQASTLLFDATSADSLEHRWTRTAALLHALRHWDGERRLAAFCRTFRDEHTHLTERFTQLIPIVSMATAPEIATDHAFGAALTSLRKQCSHEVHSLEKAVCDFISRGVLKSRITNASRRAELESMGFKMSAEPDFEEMFHKIVGLFLILGGYFTVTLGLFGPQGLPVQRRLLLGVMVAEIYCVAVVISIFVTTRNQNPDAERAWGTYLFAALVAAGASLASAFGLQVLFEGSLPAAAYSMRVTWAWCLLAFITSLATSYNCSTVAKSRGLRWLEGIGQAAVTAIVALMVRLLLIQLAQDFHMNVEIPPTWRVTTNSLFAGFVIGASVPTWFRHRRKHRRAEMETYHPEALPA